MSVISTPIVVLNLPKPNKALITYAKAVHDHLEGNASFPSPNPTLTVFAEDINAFDKAETAAATKAKGTAEARDAKKKKVQEDLKHLRNYVQGVVEAQTPSRDATVLIASAFMSVRKSAKPTRAEVIAKNTGVSGTVALDGKAVAPVAVYCWQYSLDQQTWTSLPEKLQIRAEVSGLTPLKTHYFRVRTLTRNGETGFSQVVNLLVV